MSHVGRQELALSFAQGLSDKTVYSMKNDVVPKSCSRRTAYRNRKELKDLGVLKPIRGKFILNTTAAHQPLVLFQGLLPSLYALKNARRFGRYYNESDINFARKNILHKLITLDYKAWELTKFQYPSDFYIYVEDVEKTAHYLKDNRFSEGQKGRIVILPMKGDFHNEIQRVYFDCLAKGGRSIQDAVAIELLYRHHLVYKANFPTELTQKVEDDLPTKN